ncbi:Aste57867_1815 [Aphanomyces stellatus]|uniref:Aste57867_1815 protein n=1 Tax=Aphanomyces stellatus TaxID=120398 RepID=A0A485KB93_9STRA|nr:hypothetical protein As57867_001813 [Aphanomyces stellatus]VFT79024.1 Aste57867_1815 [Aphanomyces stellatus]
MHPPQASLGRHDEQARLPPHTFALGEKKLYISYYRNKLFADILEDGSMRFNDKIYMNAASLAFAMKRTLNPALKTDPGWLSLYSTDSNKCLKDIREMWIEKITPPSTASAAAASYQNPSSSFLKPGAPVIRPKQPAHSFSSLPPREVCGMCKRDRGNVYVTCDACNASYHNACVGPAAKTASPWYCERCIQQHCAMILKFLGELRQVAVLYEHQPSPSTAEVDAINHDATPTTEATADGSEASAVSNATDTAVTSPEATVASPDATDASTLDAAAPPSPASLLSQIDALIAHLESPTKRLDVLANSTGELLVHLSSLDIATVLGTVEDHLNSIAETCSRDNEPADDAWTSPGIDGVLHVLNLRHGIMSARFHVKRTTAALTTLSDKRVRSCDTKQAKLEEGFQKELKLRSDWEARVVDAKTDVSSQQTHLSQVNALIDNAVRHRKTLRAMSLAKRFIPAYRVCTADLTLSSDHLLITIVADKLKGLAASLNEWELMEDHFEGVKAQLEAQKDGTERPHKMAKLEIDLPRPPSLKLVERQLKEVEKNLAGIQGHKTDARKTFQTIQQSFLERLSARDKASDEWKALLKTMEDMVLKCTPAAERKKNDAVVAPIEASTSNDTEASTSNDQTTSAQVEEDEAMEGDDKPTPGATVAVKTTEAADSNATEEEDEEEDVGPLVDRDGPEVVSLDGDDDDEDEGLDDGPKVDAVQVVTIDDDEDDEEDDEEDDANDEDYDAKEPLDV